MYFKVIITGMSCPIMSIDQHVHILPPINAQYINHTPKAMPFS